MPPPEVKKEAHKPAGHVRHDGTGRAIWEWAAESGRHALDSTSRLLKRLDLPGLTLAGDDKRKEEDQAALDTPQDAGQPEAPTFGGPREIDASGNRQRSFNPYDTRTAARQPVRKTAVSRSAGTTRPAKKPGFFARLFGRR